MPRGVRNTDRPIHGLEQEAEALGVTAETTDDFDFDPGSYSGPLGMKLPEIPGYSLKWVSYTNPENGQDDPREIMKHRSPAMGMWDFVRPEQHPDFTPMKVSHASHGPIIATQGMALMCIRTKLRDKLVAHFDSIADRQVFDIAEGDNPSQQDSRSPFALSVKANDGRMRQPTIRE